MKQLDLLRRIIREELQKTLREELPKLLQENKTIIKEVKVPETLNSKPSIPIVRFGNNNNPLMGILNETAISMHEAETKQERVSDAPTSVSGMLSSAVRSSDVSMVEINEVPDFTNMINRMNK